MRATLLILFSLSLIQFKRTDQPNIEIYLLKKRIAGIEIKDVPKNISTPFSVSSSDLKDTAFIEDSDILRYDSSHYIIIVSKSAAEKISALKPDMAGIQFALCVNKKPIIAGYIISKYTSQPALSYMLLNKNDTCIKIDALFINEQPELRKDSSLIRAFQITNRLK